ncbi:MAG TPA: hypothetical protein VNO79_07850 [Actinomycetota bacterium]|nr:hypothetical protein [Actinomycetota bacterium]
MSEQAEEAIERAVRLFAEAVSAGRESRAEAFAQVAFGLARGAVTVPEEGQR